MSRNTLYVLIISMSLTALLLSGCASTEVTFEQLLANPSQYNEKNITIEGFVFLGWEVIVLCEELVPSGHINRHLVPNEKHLWIEGGITKAITENLYQQSTMGPIEQYGKVRIKGTFQYGQRYGHCAGYEYQIIPTEIELLPWSPPQ
jgi:hypothetical protein